MIHSSHGSRENTHIQIRAKTKATATIVVFLIFLLTPRIWAENRKEYIHGNGGVVAVETGAAGCGSYTFYSVPEDRSFGVAGGSGSVIVQGGDSGGCTSWTASKSAAWITITGGGSGDGNVAYTVASNTGAARTGTITAAGSTFTISQAGCTYTISPASATIASGGESRSLTVTTNGSSCTWTASKSVAWITFTDATSGTGSGTVSYSVQSNSGAVRSSTITAGGNTFTVSQSGSVCQQTCQTQKQTCESATAGCPDYCLQQVFSQPACVTNPSTCATMYNGCLASCPSMILTACTAQYNQCTAGCQ